MHGIFFLGLVLEPKSKGQEKRIITNPLVWFAAIPINHRQWMLSSMHMQPYQKTCYFSTKRWSFKAVLSIRLPSFTLTFVKSVTNERSLLEGSSYIKAFEMYSRFWSCYHYHKVSLDRFGPCYGRRMLWMKNKQEHVAQFAQQRTTLFIRRKSTSYPIRIVRPTHEPL